jgi:hypothetical protein
VCPKRAVPGACLLGGSTSDLPPTTLEARPIAVAMDEDAAVAQHVRQQQRRFLGLLARNQLNGALSRVRYASTTWARAHGSSWRSRKRRSRSLAGRASPRATLPNRIARRTFGCVRSPRSAGEAAASAPGRSPPRRPRARSRVRPVGRPSAGRGGQLGGAFARWHRPLPPVDRARSPAANIGGVCATWRSSALGVFSRAGARQPSAIGDFDPVVIL